MNPSTTKTFSKLLMALVAAATLQALPGAAHTQEAAPDGTEAQATRRHLVGSSLFVLANAVPLGDEAPQFFQLNYGFRLTPTDVLSVEAITWRYHAPLGIPYWASLDAAEDVYPGFVREFGLGLAYQRYLWGDLYAQVHLTPFLRQYLDEESSQIQTGFQLFSTLRVGYHLGLFGDRVFVEPSLAMTYWPITTNAPDSFSRVDQRWPNYFLFEPGLHFGFEL